MKTIYSDDPQALEKLKEKLKICEEMQIKMKSINKIFRDKTSPEDKKVKIMAMGISEQCFQALKNPQFSKEPGYPQYRLSNNNQEISRLKKRIAQLEKLSDKESTEETINGVRIFDNSAACRVQMFFNGKPAPEIIQALKSNGFKWSPSNMAWQRLRGEHSLHVAKRIASQIPA